MKTPAASLLLGAALAGCVPGNRLPPASLRPEPPPAATAPTQPPPSTRSIPTPPVAPVNETPPPPPPVLSPRVQGEDGLAQEVSARLARTEKIIAQIDPSLLTPERREIYAGIQDFVAKAKEALSVKDLPRAQNLADKASTLVDHLAEGLKGSR